MDPATGKWLASSAKTRATMNWPMITIGHDQKNAGPAWLRPTPKLPYVPVETLMKLNAIAKFDRKPSVRLSSGLMPRERRCASSLADWSWTDPDTISSSCDRMARCGVDPGVERMDARLPRRPPSDRRNCGRE